MNHVLVTGASTGIGLSLTSALLNKGYFVWGAVRNPQSLAGLQAKFPDFLEVLQLDVTSSADIQAAFSRVSARKDIQNFTLVNNAGIALGGPLESIPVQEWRKLFDVNVFGLVEMTQIFLPLLRQQQGRVINIGSVSGRIATPFLAPYAGSKFAVRAISDSLRREMRPFGVKVVLIEPGPIQTPIWEKSMAKSNTIKKELSPELTEIYGATLQALEASVAATARDAVPVERVIEKVISAMGKNPRPYNLVGKNIHLQMALTKILPTLWLDKLMAHGFRGKN